MCSSASQDAWRAANASSLVSSSLLESSSTGRAARLQVPPSAAATTATPSATTDFKFFSFHYGGLGYELLRI